MNGETIDLRMMAFHRFEKAVGPSKIEVFGVAAGADGDQGWLWIVGRKLSHEAAVERCVFLGIHVSATAPGLIAHTPPAHAEGIFVAVGGSFRSERDRADGRIAVLHPVVELARR